ncbi:VWA domain-containing protein [uncultured Sphingorhabdus sp.]|uniref:vWA domain-containing protein n=1 Tax=uncultured Sphingorhabdus sp. TaxID=1686106 RepID=UPI0026339FB8|nr:VWA domain-containing protein [uncultured Sphingorhabdus sp.]HMS19743.1 VWA domain-containing protein [Sphingorhabdus sp.]
MRKLLFLASMALLSSTWPVIAQDEEQYEEDDSYNAVVVTGSVIRVSAGGAQDINHFRSLAIEDGEMPRPESLTVEGLLGQHDLLLPLARDCSQLLCLATESMRSNLPTRPDDRLFVGLGFASNVDAESWKRDPLNLVAVVDQSGSMSGEPLDLVKLALTRIAEQMQEGDRMSVILYGDEPHVWLQPTNWSGNKQAIVNRIAEIESHGSTNMEAGLKLGYSVAYDDAPRFKGNTRVMLFTDEQPNVGATDAGSFMGMAQRAADRGIGMTTIGVGVQYDGALATKIGSVKGGNLFFVEDEARVAKLFGEELNTMVSEIARDIRISMTPTKGYAVSGVFGVPDGMMENGRDGTVSIVVPSAFFSTEAGGIFVSLAKDSKRANLPEVQLAPDRPLMTVQLSYRAIANGRDGSDQLSVAAPLKDPSANLAKAQALVDQYLVMKQATLAYHRDGKAKEAYRLLSGLSSRLGAINGEDMEQEMQLVTAMTDKAAKMSGYTGESSLELRRMAIEGSWEIKKAEGFVDLARGDLLKFDQSDSTLYIERRRPRAGLDDEDSEEFRFDGNKLQLPESRLELTYKEYGDRASLTAMSDGIPLRLDLKRVF